MNTEFIRERWIPALRSGEFRQGRNVLRRDGSYCCLGVACDLLIEQGLLPEWERAVAGVDSVGGNHKFLPLSVVEYIDIDEDGGNGVIRAAIHDLFPDDDANCLAELNDDGYSFAQIADILERAVELVEER